MYQIKASPSTPEPQRPRFFGEWTLNVLIKDLGLTSLMKTMYLILAIFTPIQAWVFFDVCPKH